MSLTSRQTLKPTLIPTLLIAGAMTLSPAAPAEAAFILIDDFSGAADDAAVVGRTASNGETWSAAWGQNNDNIVTIVDGAQTFLRHKGSSNQGASLAFGSSLDIPDGGKGTLFFRARPSPATGANFAVGASDDNVPETPFGGQSDKTGFATLVDDDIDGDGTNIDMTEGDWNLLWFDYDLAVDADGRMVGYLQRPGESSRSQIFVDEDLRDYDNNGLASVGFVANGTNGGNLQYDFDDFYVDNTGFNSANPIPEPASLAMGLVGLTLLAMRRGRPA